MGLCFYATVIDFGFVVLRLNVDLYWEGALTRLNVISIENLAHSIARQQQEHNSPMTKWHTTMNPMTKPELDLYPKGENKHVKLCFERSFDINRLRDLKHECVGMLRVCMVIEGGKISKICEIACW